jgi:hypothetical protein
MATHEININMDKKCVRCGKGGATQGGYCLKCIEKNLVEGKYDHIIKPIQKQVVQDYLKTEGQKTMESKRIAVREHLKCVLTETEIKAAGAQLARSYSEITDLEDQKKSSASNFKARIDISTAQASILARKIQNGYEFRDIDCEEVWNWDEKTVDVVRLDTFEVMKSRIMTAGELQQGLFDKPTEEE